MQVKNLSTTGTTEWDTYWLSNPRWSGANGEAELIPYDPFTSTPDPRPGEHIKASWGPQYSWDAAVRGRRHRPVQHHHHVMEGDRVASKNLGLTVAASG
jgi:hypothetical protein